MGFYRERIVPYLIHLAMRRPDLAAYRKRLLHAAEGRVLEIGVGSGLNFPFYEENVTRVIGLEPSPGMLSLARKEMNRATAPVELLEGSAEDIPLEDKSVDNIVTTWTLCSIPDPSRALAEMRRVLRPDGRLLFVEHGRAPDAGVRRWQDRLNPLWTHIGGGCNLNRPIAELIVGSGFHIERIETGYMKGPKPMTFTYEGVARSE